MWGIGPTGTIFCGLIYTTCVNRRSDISIRKVAYKSMGPEVVSLDVVKVRGILERGVFPVQLLHPPNSRSADIRSDIKPIDLLIFGYPWRISRMLHLKCLT